MARSVYCVGGVVFGLCGGGRVVFHVVEFLCAEWWLAYLLCFVRTITLFPTKKDILNNKKRFFCLCRVQSGDLEMIIHFSC